MAKTKHSNRPKTNPGLLKFDPAKANQTTVWNRLREGAALLGLQGDPTNPFAFGEMASVDMDMERYLAGEIF